MIDKRSDEYAGEAATFDCIEKNLPDEIIAYYNREIKGLQFDFCLLVKNTGLVIIEVKGWNTSHIIKVENPDTIHLDGYDDPVGSPKKQARSYRFAVLNKIQESFGISPVVLDMVCYPFLSEKDYKNKGLNIVSEPESTLFKEDINDKNSFTKKIIRLFQNSPKTHSDKLNSDNTKKIRSLFENDFEDKKFVTNYSHLSCFPNTITTIKIKELIDEYFSGVKQTIFVASSDNLIAVVNSLKDTFDLRKISVVGNKLNFNANTQNSFSVAGNRFSCFAFDVFCVEKLESICLQQFDIYNGQFNDEQKECLIHIAENSSFNYEQYVVEHAPVKKDMQIRAGAGTGKTFSMISRISYICHQQSNSGVVNPASDIAMLTFTRDAATNMKTRLKTQFMNYFVLTQQKNYLDLVANIERMRISTIHSFAKEIIQNTSLPLGIGTDFTTVGGNYQREKILKKNLGLFLSKRFEKNPNLFFNIPVNVYNMEDMILDFITKIYEKGCDIKNADASIFGVPPSGMEYLSDLIEDVIKQAEKEYTQFLIENNSLSLNEYMIYLNKCVNDDSFNKNNYQYKYMFIDEFQDVDDAQISSFISMQKKLEFNFFIVGDLKQSIYRFRGATMNAFSKMGCDDQQKWLSFSLKTNYRSDRRLLGKYSSLFESLGNSNLLPYDPNIDVLEGVKESKLAEDELLTKVEYTKDDIADGVMYDKLFDLIKERKKELEDLSLVEKLSSQQKTIAILVRTNNQIKDILTEARKRDVLVESDSNGNLYKLQSSIDLCKLTASLCNPYNEIFLFDLLMSNNVNIDFNPLSIYGLPLEEKKKTMIDCLDKYFTYVMQKSWGELISDVQSKPVLMVLRQIYEATEPWKKYSASFEKQTFYRINYELLFEDLSLMNRKSYLTLDSINETLNIAITTGMEESSRDVVDTDDRVRVICTTVHGSKGLEYDTVIMPNTTDALDKLKRNSIEVTYVDNKIGYYLDLNGKPAQNSNFYTENEIEEIKMEECRILYVALTRAINKFIWFKPVEIEKNCWAGLLEDIQYED